ncbi:unnamed protein product [Tilletia controversa]|nr:hypothetical protein CF335_g8909 [Tilletia laevis]CAD6897659.1 unnamed protein product [Tilletia caries]CAD6898242.1 unnamed protein product [Tilletia controversa]CAD6933389.1 unnamed protein product [Tilletia controversa]CAD6958509.1 unnamed protein product [Tilletia controversa]
MARLLLSAMIGLLFSDATTPSFDSTPSQTSTVQLRAVTTRRPNMDCTTSVSTGATIVTSQGTKVGFPL